MCSKASLVSHSSRDQTCQTVKHACEGYWCEETWGEKVSAGIVAKGLFRTYRESTMANFFFFNPKNLYLKVQESWWSDLAKLL